MYLRIFEDAGAVPLQKISAFKRIFSESVAASKVLLKNLYKKYPSVLELVDSIALISIIILFSSAMGLFSWWCHIVDAFF